MQAQHRKRPLIAHLQRSVAAAGCTRRRGEIGGAGDQEHEPAGEENQPLEEKHNGFSVL
jgi:hypothetical protein